jgi:gamma-glutamyltranspeptidase/glutathione hydrolase
MHGGRPTVFGRNGAVSSGHYLATGIGVHILRSGGNAFDAAVAAGVALQVLKPHQNGFAGENPMLIRTAGEKKVIAVSGHGPAPRAATIERMQNLGVTAIPGDGLLGSIVPPAFATYMFLLKNFGSRDVATVLEPAMALAIDGFAMADDLHRSIAGMASRFRAEWPSSAALFLPGGTAPIPGTVFKNADLGSTLKRLIDSAGGVNREAGCDAATDLFYRGRIAQEILDFATNEPCLDATGESHTSLLTQEDFSAYRPTLEEPAQYSWNGLEVYKCPPWTQGPVLLQSLSLLKPFDLRALGHNSAKYIHTVLEAMKLAFADREFYYGDPDFSEVPMERLLEDSYAGQRARLIDPDSASLELRPGGFEPLRDYAAVADIDQALASSGDTTKLDIMDAIGNSVSITTSGGWLPSSPVIPGLGFPLGTRGQMFSLQPNHPNCLAPGKRPRTTLTPSLALKDGAPYLVFGSPGGDAQDQWALQFLLNHELFGMSLQEAIDSPTFNSAHWPGSFYPRQAVPGSLSLEDRIDETVIDELRDKGHRITMSPSFSGGNTCACRMVTADDGKPLLSAAASPRLEPAYALAW